MEDAFKAGKSLSRWLEEQDPSAEYKDGMDAFERQLMLHNIKTGTDMSAGYYADEFDAFSRGGEATKVLGVEFLSRCWRAVKFGSTRALYGSDDSGVGTAMRPYFDAAVERSSQIAPAIPISEAVAITTPINTNVYRAVYLLDDVAEERMVRVTEGGEIPGATLKSAEHATDLFKYGRKIKATYEQLRRIRIDTIGFHLSRMAAQAESDKLPTIMDVMTVGDGNSNAAPVVDLTDLDPDATAGTLTLKAWLKFKMLFRNPYALTHALAQDDVALQLMLLDSGSANIPLVALTQGGGFGGFDPINPELRDNVRLGFTEDAPADKIVGFDKRFAIERVTEIGSNITETTQWITNQTRELVMSEVEGFAKIDDKAVQVLNLAA